MMVCLSPLTGSDYADAAQSRPRQVLLRRLYRVCSESDVTPVIVIRREILLSAADKHVAGAGGAPL